MTTLSLDDRITALIESRPEALADPYPLYAELREHAPVHHWGTTFVVSRFDDIKTIAKDTETFSNRAYSVGSRADAIRAGLSGHARVAFDEVAAFEGMYMNRVDGDEHQRLRGIAHRAFTPRKMAELGSLTQQFTDELLDGMIERSETDFVQGVAGRLPVMIMSSLLNIPLEDADMIKSWTERIGQNRGGQVVEDLLDAHKALAEFREYVAGIIDHHRNHPDTTDLVSALMGAESEQRLSHDELLATVVVLLFAGSDTTAALLANGLHAILTHGDQWEDLQADPAERVATAVEELARFVSPVQTLWRVTTRSVELSGTEIPAGSTIVLLLGSANRDPRQFDDPDRLDIRRDHNRHIAFFYGAHFCIGASLARTEGSAVFGTLARRFPDLRLFPQSVPYEWRGNIQFRTVMALDVEFGAPIDAHPTEISRS